MNESVLMNIVKFLERTPATGKECYAWCEAHMAVSQEILKLRSVDKSPAKKTEK